MNERKDMDGTGAGDVSSQERWAAIRNAIKQYVGAKETEYQELVDEKYEQILESYYVLATKQNPTERESDWLYSIMEDAESNEELAILLEIVDEITFDELGYNERAFKPIIRETYKRAKNQVIKIRDTYHQSGKLPSLLDIKLLDVADARDKSESFFSGLFSSIFKKHNPCMLLRVSVMSAGALVVAVTAIKAIVAASEGHQYPGTMHSTSEEAPSGAISLDTDLSSRCAIKQVGWISDSLEGSETAYREIYDPNEYTAAHPFLPPQSEIYLQPSQLSQGKTVSPIKVRVIDEGTVNNAPEGMLVSHGTAEALDIVDVGVADVEVARVVVNNQSRDELDSSQVAQLASFRDTCASVVESVERTESAIAASLAESE